MDQKLNGAKNVRQYRGNAGLDKISDDNFSWDIKGHKDFSVTKGHPHQRDGLYIIPTNYMTHFYATFFPSDWYQYQSLRWRGKRLHV